MALWGRQVGKRVRGLAYPSPTVMCAVQGSASPRPSITACECTHTPDSGHTYAPGFLASAKGWTRVVVTYTGKMRTEDPEKR